MGRDCVWGILVVVQHGDLSCQSFRDYAQHYDIWARIPLVDEILSAERDSNLRIYHEPIFWSRLPTLAFQYKGKTRVFRKMKITDFEHVLDPIYKRFPELRPTLVDRGI